MQHTFDGLLLVNKPTGISSFGVVAKVRGIWRQELREQGESIKKAKVGHTGTLDPLASGLMILVLGSYCKRAGEFSKLDKTYEVELTLGMSSTTGDQEGEISQISNRTPELKELNQVLEGFIGETMQTPPIFSAIKVDGQRAYKLARQGKQPKLEARPIIISSITDLNYKYPIITFTVAVSSGTYIRSLVEDIGRKLDTGAYMSALKRTKVGKFGLENSMDLTEVTLDKIKSSIIQLEGRQEFKL